MMHIEGIPESKLGKGQRASVKIPRKIKKLISVYEPNG